MQNKNPKSLSFGFVMDPISDINIKKDSTFAMMLEVQRRGHILYYMTQSDLYLEDHTVFANVSCVKVMDNSETWYELEKTTVKPLHEISWNNCYT